MDRITSYEIYLSVDANGLPVNGFAKYQVSGQPAMTTTNVMGTGDLAALAVVLEGNNTYFDSGTSQLVKKS